jgi:selenocysteine-specific translation elongation factor
LFLSSVGKKSEAEGTIVYHRVEGGIVYSFLDDAQFPEKIQGYSRIASIADYAFFLLPKLGKISSPDGEIAVLLDSFGLRGSFVALDEEPPTGLEVLFKGTALESYAVERRSSKSSIIDLAKVGVSRSAPSSSALVYLDRAFSVKGVGVVALGFVLAGKVSLHDELRLAPHPQDLRAEVRGIQVNDVDQEEVGSGIRVGLSLKGVEVKDLAKVSWLDDGSLQLADSLDIDFKQSKFYKQPLEGKALHLQLPGEIRNCKVSTSSGGLRAELSDRVPVWPGMRVSIIDLNGKTLRVAGGGQVRA